MNYKPNIVLIVTDDQRYDTIHALGNYEIKTPNLDGLVETGTSFINAYIMGSSCPAVCMPSRAMLFTGRRLFELVDRGEVIPQYHITIGEMLKKVGYICFGTGKWHNGTESYARTFNAGDDIFFGGMDDHWNVAVYTFEPDGRYSSVIPKVVDFRSQKVFRKVANHIHAGVHSSNLFTDAAIEFLKSYNLDNPFFIYIGYMAPHDPRTMPEEFLKMYNPDKITIPPNFMSEHPFNNGALNVRDELLADFPRKEEEIRRHIVSYYAMISHLDRNIGRVIEALEATRYIDNTLIIFTSDNGLAVGRHGLMGKQNLYEHSIKVPLIFKGPDIPCGEIRDTLCYLSDIFPTLVELLGIPKFPSITGESFAHVISTASSPFRDRLHFAYEDKQRAVTDGRFKLIEYAIEDTIYSQLFDLLNDPWEIHNKVDSTEYLPHLLRLRSELTLWKTELGDNLEEGERFWKIYNKARGKRE